IAISDAVGTYSRRLVSQAKGREFESRLPLQSPTPYVEAQAKVGEQRAASLGMGRQRLIRFACGRTRFVELAQFKSTVTVRSTQHRDVASHAFEPDGAIHPDHNVNERR